MTFSRLFMFFILKSSLNKVGKEITNKDIVIMTYGGLRGAISLSLALMVTFNENFDQRYRELVIFYVASMISLTMLFNGMTIKYVMKKINFNPTNPVKQKI